MIGFGCALRPRKPTQIRLLIFAQRPSEISRFASEPDEHAHPEYAHPGSEVTPMAVCKECENEVDSLVSVKVEGKTKKLCEDCADRAREAAEIAEQSESVVQSMMGFKGRR
jgi:hypothetical protein